MLYFTSDLHGEYDLFLQLLEKINFSQKDQMIVCGDIVDKGPNSIKLAKYLKGMPNVRCILGNHDYAFLKYYWTMMQHVTHDFDGVLKRLQEYFPTDGHLLDWDTVDWLESLPWYIQEEEFICVHAGAPLDDEKKILPLEEAEVEWLLYDRTFKEPNVLPNDDRCVFFGHTPVSYVSGENKILLYPRKNAPKTVKDFYKIHLDLGTMITGVLGCICADTLQTFYVTKR